MKTNTLKMMAVAAAMVSATGAFAMLSDEEALMERAQVFAD